MPRPTTKAQLLSESQVEYQALEQFLSGLTPDEMTQPGALGQWSVKDVLAHLYEWQHMFFGWYEAGLCGETPSVPAQGFNWGQLPALNQMIYEKYRERALDDVSGEFRTSHERLLTLAKSLSEEDLFTPGLYPWMRKNTLAAYLVSCMGSHYRWARTEIRKGLKSRQKMETG